jgi:phenylacetate-coenzyme A ligase PaaK-like adenylate-forming protein
MLDQPTVAEAMQRVLANEHLTPAGLDALQDRRLRELVQFAAAKSPFYAELYRSIDLEHAPLTDFPVVNKPLIQANFDRVVTDPRVKLADVKRFCEGAHPGGSPFFLGEFAAMLTSGTTGNRGHYVWDRGALAEAIAVGFRQSNRGQRGGGPAPPQRIAAVVQIDAYDATNILLSMIPQSVGEKRLFDIRDDFQEICRGLQEFQPTLLASYPYMLWLLSEAQRDARNPLKIKPGRITSSADVLNPSDRRSIRDAFGVDVHNYYCSTEFPYIAWECDAHDGLHVNADTLILESVDHDNRPVPPGRLGDKVLVTSLSNRVLPLVRYEMSDQVEYATAPCPCGCKLPRIRTVAGREEHILSLPGVEGNTIRLIEEYVDSIIGPKPEVATYQVIQETPSRLTINAVGRRPFEWPQVRAAVESGLRECFAKYGVAVDRVQVDLREVDALEPISPGTKKVCRVWNRSG